MADSVTSSPRGKEVTVSQTQGYLVGLTCTPMTQNNTSWAMDRVLADKKST